jgi:multiple sugar transport system substrate-binding protein
MPQYAALGAVVPVDDLAKQAGIDLTVFPEEVQKLSHWNGKLMGVPLDIHPIAMYINTDMVKAAGLDPASPPKDRTTFLDWAQKLTKPDGSQFGVCFGAANVQSFRVWYGWLWQNDAKFISDDMKTITINSPEAAETLQFGRDLIAKWKVAAPESQNPDVDFQNKKCAIHFQGPWWITGYMNTPGLNFMTAEQPVLFKHPGVWASDHFFGISKQDNTERQANAMKFVKWMGENAATWGTAGQVPANSKAREDKKFTEDVIYPYIKAFIAEVPYAHLTPVIPQSTEIFAEGVQTPLVVNYQGAFLGQKDVAAALKDMQEGIQAVLDKG